MGSLQIPWGLLWVCLGFAWGVMSQCLGTYDLRCLLGDLILFCLGMDFSSYVLGDVVFWVLFSWGRRFRHLFCLGICLGWICLGLWDRGVFFAAIPIPAIPGLSSSYFLSFLLRIIPQPHVLKIRLVKMRFSDSLLYWKWSREKHHKHIISGRVGFKFPRLKLKLKNKAQVFSVWKWTFYS